LNLTRIGLDIQSGEEFIVVSVVNQFGILNDNCSIGVAIEFFEVPNAKFKVKDERWRYFNFLGAINKAGTLQS
jgi:hypothetical protein